MKIKQGDVRVIMGIDPGTNTTGYGVIEIQDRTVRCIVMGDIDLHKLTDPYQKLSHIFSRISSLIKEYKPEEVALESPFFGENIQSMLKLGRAQGVAMAAALSQGVDVVEYAPRRVKQAITGSGSASKEQVAGILKGMLKLEELPKKLDATDGLAVAMCHYFQTATLESRLTNGFTQKKKALGGGAKTKSWDSFVKENPERIKTPRTKKS